jgi:ElaB/YqjD/DUF883 family membrane-anchored ribosome-binding protein
LLQFSVLADTVSKNSGAIAVVTVSDDVANSSGVTTVGIGAIVAAVIGLLHIM